MSSPAVKGTVSAGTKASPQSKTLEREGWMIKEGGSVKTWKKRYFRLEDGFLSYSKKDSDKKVIDKIDLRQSGAINSDSKKKQKNCFDIVMPGRLYGFSCDTLAEKDSWVESLVKSKDRALHKEAGLPTATTTGEVRQSFAIGSLESDSNRVAVEDFDLLNLIGKGSFGKVMQVRKKDTGQIYAMKMLDKKHLIEHEEVEHTLTEKNILQSINHPFLVNLHYSFQTADKLYFILDFVNGGELFFHLQREKRFPEERAAFYAAEILLALEHLHENGIVYRDLKPENILICADGHLVLTDFGLCKEGLDLPDAKTGTFCGTPEYLAPEVLKGVGYGKEVDWWSFGSLVYEMMGGLPPFYSQDVQEMYRRIMSDELKFPSHFSESSITILTALLERDVKKRLADPATMKAHPFFAAIDWTKLVNKQVQPSFVPDVADKADVSQIDPVFIQEQPGISPTEKGAIDDSEQADFEGFTYNPNKK